MQFHHQKDFIFRKATLSDRDEVVALTARSMGEEVAAELRESFAEIVQNTQSLFEVALNSNGVLIAAIGATKEEWKWLAANPNFLKKELKTLIVERIKKWAEQAPDATLKLRSKMIVGDWKAFVKAQGAKIESSRDGTEMIRFSP